MVACHVGTGVREGEVVGERVTEGTGVVLGTGVGSIDGGPICPQLSGIHPITSKDVLQRIMMEYNGS